MDTGRTTRLAVIHSALLRNSSLSTRSGWGLNSRSSTPPYTGRYDLLDRALFFHLIGQERRACLRGLWVKTKGREEFFPPRVVEQSRWFISIGLYRSGQRSVGRG